MEAGQVPIGNVIWQVTLQRPDGIGCRTDPLGVMAKVIGRHESISARNG
jgi:hypothetical protein